MCEIYKVCENDGSDKWCIDEAAKTIKKCDSFSPVTNTGNPRLGLDQELAINEVVGRISSRVFN